MYVITIAYAVIDDVDTLIDNVDMLISENVHLVTMYVVEHLRRGVEEWSYFDSFIETHLAVDEPGQYNRKGK